MKQTLSVLTALAIIAGPAMTFATDTSASPSPHKVEYTCSMHPEVLQDKPGKCPKCGMKLEEKRDDKKDEKPKSS